MENNKNILQAELKSVIAKDSVSLWKLKRLTNKLFLYSEKHDDGIKVYYLDKKDLLESKNITSTSTPTIDSDEIEKLNEEVSALEEIISLCGEEMLRLDKIILDKNELNEEIDDLKEENWEQYREISWLKDDVRSRDAKILALEGEVKCWKKLHNDLSEGMDELNEYVSDLEKIMSFCKEEISKLDRVKTDQ